MKKPEPKYRRILLKISGESLGGANGIGVCADAVHEMARQICEVRELGVQVVVVAGGGNIFRGLSAPEHGIERATGDYMGMLATVINALALRFNLDGKANGDATLEDVGKKFGVTRERIRQIQEAALKKLRKMIEKLDKPKSARA